MERRKRRRRRTVEHELVIEVTQEVIDLARREGLSGAQMIALAIQLAMPDATEIEVNGQNLWSPGKGAGE